MLISFLKINLNFDTQPDKVQGKWDGNFLKNDFKTKFETFKIFLVVIQYDYFLGL